MEDEEGEEGGREDEAEEEERNALEGAGLVRRRAAISWRMCSRFCWMEAWVALLELSN